ncbi:huntingtin-interacting protein 1 [Lates japonicus]|uniref:Huntingtin-interacting protein 1 n=1 Tax=Lates japonicus TaxID=270547 RepID=A0AAD3MPB3_LATJO|nr:huntingtin-interacting protein 1 [Lates japonicus]
MFAEFVRGNVNVETASSGLELQQGLGDAYAGAESSCPLPLLWSQLLQDRGAQKILASCTELMQAVKELILSSKICKGTSWKGSSLHEGILYKNSRWTEGLISASSIDRMGSATVAGVRYQSSLGVSYSTTECKADKDSANLHLPVCSRRPWRHRRGCVASTVWEIPD